MFLIRSLFFNQIVSHHYDDLWRWVKSSKIMVRNMWIFIWKCKISWPMTTVGLKMLMLKLSSKCNAGRSRYCVCMLGYQNIFLFFCLARQTFEYSLLCLAPIFEHYDVICQSNTISDCLKERIHGYLCVLSIIPQFLWKAFMTLIYSYDFILV